MSNAWYVRTYKEGDESGITKLLKRNFEDWLWEYKQNPFGHLIGVAAHDNQLVGHMAMVPVNMKIGTKTVLASQAVDLVVHPEFRRQGIFLAIGRFLAEETERKAIDIWYGIPNKLAHSGHLKYGWFDVCKVPLLIKPISLGRVSETFMGKHKLTRFFNRYKISRKTSKIILQLISSIDRLFAKIFNQTGDNDSKKNFEIRAISSFDERVDVLWKKASKDYPLAVVRTSEYLNWRYVKKPQAKYRILSAERSGEIVGYIVLKTREEENLKSGYIVDIFAQCSDKSLIQSLILKAIEHLKEEKVDLIYCWMLKNGLSTRVYYKTLRYNGFTHFFGRTHPLIARANSPRLSKYFIGDPKNWFITIGDSDHI